MIDTLEIIRVIGFARLTIALMSAGASFYIARHAWNIRWDLAWVFLGVAFYSLTSPFVGVLTDARFIQPGSLTNRVLFATGQFVQDVAIICLFVRLRRDKSLPE